MTHGTIRTRMALAGLVFLGGVSPVLLGQADPIQQAIQSQDPDVQKYNEHLMFLASPFLEGRLPGTRGMEIAKDYVEHYLREAGLEPAFPVVTKNEAGEEVETPFASYRQAFPLGGTTEVTRSALVLEGGGQRIALVDGKDYRVTGMGGSGTVDGPVVFVGYGINNEDRGYVSLTDEDDLTGKVAMMLRFEPMDEHGKSLWAEGNGGPWSGVASFANKVRTVMEHNPSAVIIVNTPGADDPRAGTLLGANNAGGRLADVPVLHMSPEAADRIVRAGGAQSIMDLRRRADQGRAVVELDAEVSIDAQLERKSLMAENVGGVIRGKGTLADEFIIIGAHLDHLGKGAFGSRASAEERGTTLHPGADDNASGSAGILLIADWLSREYAELPDDANARSVLIVAFSGEESGLNGSRYYVEHPIVPLDQTYLMMNFDMIGRIKNRRLSVSGSTTAEGFDEWLEPFFADSDLEVVKPQGAGGGSDHLPFLQRQIPILFGIIADFHGDYHTPRDTMDKINRSDAVRAARLFSDIAFAAAQRPETLVFSNPNAPRPQAGGGRGGIKVRVGVMPGNYDGEGGGVLLEDITENSPAQAAGLRPGDRLVRWDGQKIPDINAWMGMLRKHEPGDVVNVGVIRDGQEITLKITLGDR